MFTFVMEHSSVEGLFLVYVVRISEKIGGVAQNTFVVITLEGSSVSIVLPLSEVLEISLNYVEEHGVVGEHWR